MTENTQKGTKWAVPGDLTGEELYSLNKENRDFFRYARNGWCFYSLFEIVAIVFNNTTALP
jgi:hypothetical protein